MSCRNGGREGSDPGQPAPKGPGEGPEVAHRAECCGAGQLLHRGPWPSRDTGDSRAAGSGGSHGKRTVRTGPFDPFRAQIEILISAGFWISCPRRPPRPLSWAAEQPTKPTHALALPVRWPRSITRSAPALPHPFFLPPLSYLTRPDSARVPTSLLPRLRPTQQRRRKRSPSPPSAM